MLLIIVNLLSFLTILLTFSSVLSVDGDVNGQESYLGYLPNEDIFISGWDMCNNVKNLVFIKFDSRLNPYEVISDFYSYGTVYNTTYNELHKNYKKLLDIRLD